MTDRNSVYNNENYCIIVMPDENNEGKYNLINNKTGVVELKTSVLPEAIAAATEFDKFLRTANNKNTPVPVLLSQSDEPS